MSGHNLDEAWGLVESRDDVLAQHTPGERVRHNALVVTVVGGWVQLACGTVELTASFGMR